MNLPAPGHRWIRRRAGGIARELGPVPRAGSARTDPRELFSSGPPPPPPCLGEGRVEPISAGAVSPCAVVPFGAQARVGAWSRTLSTIRVADSIAMDQTFLARSTSCGSVVLLDDRSRQCE